MSSDDLSLRILVEIRDQVQATNLRMDQIEQNLGARIDRLEYSLDGRIDSVGRRIDRLEQHLDARIDHAGATLTQRIAESEIRTATAIHELAGTLRDVGDLLRDQRDLRDRAAHRERDID